MKETKYLWAAVDDIGKRLTALEADLKRERQNRIDNSKTLLREIRLEKEEVIMGGIRQCLICLDCGGTGRKYRDLSVSTMEGELWCIGACDTCDGLGRIEID